jgi:putative FmdB family regulatory protein
LNDIRGSLLLAVKLTVENGKRRPHLPSLTLYLNGFDRCNAMPIYEYRCIDCDHELEKLQRMSDEPLSHCPKCGAATLRRLVSAPGFRLKGSGWYETDFKKDGKRNLHDSHSPGSVSSSTDGASGEAAKPAESTKATSEPAASKPSTT